MTLFFDSLAAQRRAAGPLVVGLLWALVPVCLAAALLSGALATTAVLGAVGCASLATLAWAVLGRTRLGRALPGMLLMADISILVMNGGSYQTDLHMAYFAALAVLIVYADWFVILAGAATVAVHHLTLSVVLPSAVFQGTASLDRVVLHAAVLLIEAGALVWVTANLNVIFAASANALATAEAAAAKAEAATVAALDAQRGEKSARDGVQAAEAQTQAKERQLVVSSIGDSLRGLMQGDLTRRIAAQLPGEYAALCDDFNTATARLESTIAHVAAGAATIRHGMGDISAATADLSNRTERQAASLEETAAALGQTTATVRKTSETADHAQALAATMRQDAEQSGDVVRQAMTAMSGIETSSG